MYETIIPTEDFDDPLIEILERLTQIETFIARLIPIVEAAERLMESPMVKAMR